MTEAAVITQCVTGTTYDRLDDFARWLDSAA